MSERQKILGAVSLILCVLPLAAILYYRPYFGLMDDWSNFYLVLPKIESRGLISASLDYARQDIHWGMFRPIYPVMIWMLYQPAALWGVSVLFVLNWGAVLGSIYVLNRALSEISGVALSSLFLGEFAWLHFHDIFQHPSLQEKLLFFFGGALLLQCLAYVRDPKKRRLPWIFLLLALGFSSKASFCLYAAMGLVILLQHCVSSKKGWVLFVVYGLFTAAATVFLRQIAKQGSYTQGGLSLSKVGTNMQSPTGLFLILLSLFAIVFLVKEWRHESLTSGRLRLLSLLVGVISYLAIFLPWGIGKYLDTDIAPIATALALMLFSKLLSSKVFSFCMGGLSAIAIVVTSYKSVTIPLRLSDIRIAVGLANSFHQQNISQILMPCLEGSDAMRTYWQHRGWQGEVRFIDFSKESPRSGQVVFYDRGLCALPSQTSSVSGCEQEELMPVRWERSFHLVRLKNCKS